MDTSQLDFVAPLVLPFKDGELELTIGPANMGQITRMARVLRPVVDELVLLPQDMVQRLLGGQPAPADLAWLFELLCDRAQVATELVSIATGLDTKRVDALLPDRFVTLFALVYEANADFFSRAASVFKAAWARLSQATKAAERQPGPTPSTN